MSLMKSAAIAASIFAATLTAPAYATSVVDGSCISVADAAGCKFETNINSSNNGNASYLLAEAAYNDYNDTHLSAGADIDLIVIASSDDGSFASLGSVVYTTQALGTWSLPDYLVTYYAVKAGPNFVIYELDTPASSGSWSTAELGNKDVSHLVFFGTLAPSPAVPEPATWAMMIGGFALAGASMRRRKAAISFA